MNYLEQKNAEGVILACDVCSNQLDSGGITELSPLRYSTAKDALVCPHCGKTYPVGELHE
jgi:uncharacterized protein YbaR (Trm112 family)